ncbi:MAG: metal ABC transporter ATP-binding protein [Spirochaetota bacterium]
MNEINIKCGKENPCGQCCTVIENLTVKYDKHTAVENISFKFLCGELTAIIGPNGAGKSTVLKSILGQVKYNGSILYCSSISDSGKPRIGYVPQKAYIQQDSPINVCDFILISAGFLPAWIYIPKKKKNEIKTALSLVSAEKLIDRKIGELSGGELQRVLLACSLNPVPDILLLDEPVSAVDAKGMDIFYEIICDLRKRFHLAIVVVTHDIGSIVRHADKMILINKKILAQGSPQYVLKHPAFNILMGSVFHNTIENIPDTHHGERNG